MSLVPPRDINYVKKIVAEKKTDIQTKILNISNKRLVKKYKNIIPEYAQKEYKRCPDKINKDPEKILNIVRQDPKEFQNKIRPMFRRILDHKKRLKKTNTEKVLGTNPEKNPDMNPRSFVEKIENASRKNKQEIPRRQPKEPQKNPRCLVDDRENQNVPKYCSGKVKNQNYSLNKRRFAPSASLAFPLTPRIRFT